MPNESEAATAELRPSAAWVLCIALALLAIFVRPSLGTSRLIPSPSVLALIVGMVLGGLPGVRARLGAGAKVVSKGAIPYAIVLIGFGLDLAPLIEGGALAGGLLAVIALMAVAFGAALIAGKLLGLDPRVSLLIGAGTAVCGNSAIMAVAPTVDPKDEDLGLSIGVINLLGVAMLFALPPIAAAFGVEGLAGGALAGLTVHAVPQAIATGEAFGADAADWATLYKLLRVAMLVPVVLILAWTLARVRKSTREVENKAGLPWFIFAFVAAAGLRATGWLDGEVEGKALWGWLRSGGSLLLGAALAAIGIGLDVGRLVRVGPRVLLAATLTVAAMVAAGLPIVERLVP